MNEKRVVQSDLFGNIFFQTHVKKGKNSVVNTTIHLTKS